MLRWPLILVCSIAALAQQPPQPEPLDQALQAAWQARNNSRFDESAARRDNARALLQSVPADSPRLPGWAQQVSQLYQNASWNREARAVLEEALTWTAALGESHASHIALLNQMADSWQQDGNLLKALAFRERAAAAEEAAPPPMAATAPKGMLSAVITSSPMQVIPAGRFMMSGPMGSFNQSRMQTYSRLADLYRQLGRPDAIAALAAKLQALSSSDQWGLARFYEQHGQLDEAVAVYKKLAEGSDPQTVPYAWQYLANLYARKEQYADAISAMQKAIAAIELSDNPGVRTQSVWMRQTLAGLLRDAGQPDQADQLYQQLIHETQGQQQESQMVNAYAQYLGETDRRAQGESVLKNYLNGSNVDVPQRMNALFALANLEANGGSGKSAEEYRKAAEALQPHSQPAPAANSRPRIADMVRNAQTAAKEHRIDDAYRMALDAVAASMQASDGQQIGWFVPQLARTLTSNHEPAKAELLFQRAFAVAQNWSVETRQPLIALAQGYASFLSSSPDRSRDVPGALEKYRDILIDANGPESASLIEPLRLQMAFERGRSEWTKAETSANNLLDLQESFSGNTSEQYLSDLQNVARLYQAAGDSDRALPLLRKAIAIADLLSPPNTNADWRRAQARLDAALALARAKQFDEAESLAQEAMALQRPAKNARSPIAQQVAQIHQMREAAAQNK